LFEVFSGTLILLPAAQHLVNTSDQIDSEGFRSSVKLGNAKAVSAILRKKALVEDALAVW
jgi:hypothetical protein